MDRPTTPNTEGTAIRPEQCRHERAASAVPAWHEAGYGSPEVGEFASRPFGVAATAGGPVAVDSDGAHFPSIVGSLWASSGDLEPRINLDLGGDPEGCVGVQLRMSEAQQLAAQLETLIAAASAAHPL